MKRSSENTYIAFDTSAARNIHKIGLSKKFLELVKKKKWVMVTTQFIEDELKKQKISLIDDLEQAGALLRHCIPADDTNLKRAEVSYYKTFRRVIGESDAELLAATIAQYRNIITDDFASLDAVRKTSPPLFHRIRANCVVHIICAIEAAGLITFDIAASYYEKYKTVCFDNPLSVNRIFRDKDYVEIRTTFLPRIF